MSQPLQPTTTTNTAGTSPSATAAAAPEHNAAQQPTQSTPASTRQIADNSTGAAAATGVAVAAVQIQQHGDDDDPRHAADYAAPPPYDENDYKLPLPLAQGKLPTYEEVEQEKAADGHRHAAASCLSSLPAGVLATMQPAQRDGGGALAAGYTRPPTASVHCPHGMRVISIHPTITTTTMTPTPSAVGAGCVGSANGANNHPTDPENLLVSDDALLGTDAMFLAAFLLTFLFNWMGFLLITCACHNVAARYGALAGFGLSLAKWTLIVKNSTALSNDENSWLWWLIMGFGFLICVRSTVQYVSIKKSWRRMTVASAERMLVYDN